MRGVKLRKEDVTIAKNYLAEPELAALNNLVEQYLVFAEGQAMRRVPMHMKALEKFLHDLFDAYRFNPRPSFRIVGEQIDGSIEFAHEIYLIEAKWQIEPITQADLAVLDSRVSGHSQIGRGIFITAGCFSPDGITAHERLRPSAMIRN